MTGFLPSFVLLNPNFGSFSLVFPENFLSGKSETSDVSPPSVLAHKSGEGLSREFCVLVQNRALFGCSLSSKMIQFI
jgi:hypothetical protein